MPLLDFNDQSLLVNFGVIASNGTEDEENGDQKQKKQKLMDAFSSITDTLQNYDLLSEAYSAQCDQSDFETRFQFN